MYELEDPVVAVTDLSAAAWCERRVYFRYHVPLPDHRTEEMKIGREAEAAWARHAAAHPPPRFVRPRLRRRVRLESARLGLVGVLDGLWHDDAEPARLLPVEVKWAEPAPSPSQRMQALAYGLLVEDAFGVPVGEVALHYLPSERTVLLPLDDAARTSVLAALDRVRHLIAEPDFPEPAPPARCRRCQARNFCNDRP